MPESDKSVLDIIGWCQRLEKDIEKLKAENETLKQKFQSTHTENGWSELIVYRPPEHQTPIEISWTEIDDKEKQDYYRDNGDRRDIIGLVKKLPNPDN